MYMPSVRGRDVTYLGIQCECGDKGSYSSDLSPKGRENHPAEHELAETWETRSENNHAHQILKNTI